MENEVVLFKYLSSFIHIISFLFSCLAGILVYSGLSTKAERLQNRIRLKNSLSKNRKKVIEGSLQTRAEDWLKKAQYPLGLNGLRYYLIIGGLILSLTVYYVFFPIMVDGKTDKLTMISGVLIILLALFAAPSNPFSLFVYIMKRGIVYHQAKKNAEIFMFYDLLINEIEMMTHSRINAYNIIRNIKPYFVVLDIPFTILLSNWSNDEGPKVALDKFAQEFNSKEADALISVIKNLDDLDRKTALENLQGMHNMFVKSQIENYRRKKKITTDLLGIPIKTTHFIIILNFLAVVVTMVTFILKKSHM
jgi:hypothetical protein